MRSTSNLNDPNMHVEKDDRYNVMQDISNIAFGTPNSVI